MKTVDEKMTEEELPQPLPMTAPAEADPATAALTAAEPVEEDPGVPEEEQEDPYEGRDLPGESEHEENEQQEEPEDTEDELAEPEEVRPIPSPAPEPEAVPPATPEPAAAPAAQPATALPLPVPKPSAMKQQYWRRVLTGSAATVPDDVRERAGITDASLTDEQRDYRLLSTINRSWAVDNLGVSREQVRTDWAKLRAELAKRFHVADDEQELFAALAVESENAPRRERVKALYEAHYSAALLGKESPSLEPAEGEETLPYAEELADEARRRGESLRQQYLPLARDVAEGLNVYAGLEEEAIPAFRVLPAVPEFARSVNVLAGMDERSRQLVYAIAQEEFRARNPKKDGSLYRTMLRASRRGATGMGIGVGQALTHTAIATMNSLGNSLGEDWGRPLHKGAEALDMRARVAEETRRLLYDVVKPLQVSEEAGFAGQLLVDAAGATPAAVVACAGGAGFAALGLSGMGEAVAAARQRAPEGSHWLQYLAGVVGGGIQASIYSGMSRVGGQMLSNAISNFTRAAGKGVGSYRLASLGVLGAMGLEEAKLLFASKSAEAVGLGAQELAARLEKTASNIDWKEYGENAQDVELNLREAAMTLPFVLIASGRVALRHFRSREAVLGDGYALERWGIDEATRDAIMKERDIDRQGNMLRDALRGSRRWSAPGFIAEAARALRLLNTDYYEAFSDAKTVAEFLQLPSQNSLVPRPPFVEYSAENPEHVKLLEARHGSGEKVNRSRLPLALQLWDEWWQKAHIINDDVIPFYSRWGSWKLMPTSERRRHFGGEMREVGDMVPKRLQPGGFYAPHAESERMTMLRDRVAELHDLSYQMLLSAFPLDALSHSSRSIDYMRSQAEKARASMLEAVGLSILRRASGVPQADALDEMGKSLTDYLWRRRYTYFPPGWMSRVPHNYTKNLDEYARLSFSEKMTDFPDEFLTACRVALGFRSCASVLYELLPMTADFQTSLSRGMTRAEAYVHLLSRELGVDMSKVKGVPELLASLEPEMTDREAYVRKNEEQFNLYSQLTGYELERTWKGGNEYWRARRPNGSYTHWHDRKEHVMNDLVANASFTFMPFSYDRMAPFRNLRAEKDFDINTDLKAGVEQFSGYDNLCRVALRDAVSSWMELAPYAQPGFRMGAQNHYVYIGGRNPRMGAQMKEGEDLQTMEVAPYTLSSPLRLMQARFRTYWLRQLNGGVLSAEQAGDELVRLNVISPEELERVKDIAKPLLMPRGRNTPLKDTPPPDIPGMNSALAEHLTELSVRHLMLNLDDVPLPNSTREWFRLAPLCTLEPMPLPERALRLSVLDGLEPFTSLHNRVAARELREKAPAVAALRDVMYERGAEYTPLRMELDNSIGMNRIRSMEQSWCMEESGADAMMSASPAFWRLMERPLEGWKVMDAAEQEALRSHIEFICHTELSPEAMDAETRGEAVDYVHHGLQNLQEVMDDYPLLHDYGLIMRNERAFLRVLRPAGTLPMGIKRRFFSQSEEEAYLREQQAEPVYDPSPIYTGGELKQSFRFEGMMDLPKEMKEDPRVLPALHLLGQLRTYPGSRPYERREGIQWKGELYGGFYGRYLPSLEKGWVAETPLRDMVNILKAVDVLNSTRPDGDPLTLFDIKLPGLGEELDLGTLRNVTLYRSLENPSVLSRLMPGEPDGANAAARLPYVVQSIAGACLSGSMALSEAGDMYRSYIPMEHFRPSRSYMGWEESRMWFSRASLEYTLSNVLSDAVFSAELDNPKGGMVSLRELLLRFVEDSGFSRSLRGVDPRELKYGQLQALRLARELLLCVCGATPEGAFYRLRQLRRNFAHDEDTREALLRALISSADELYGKGRLLFRQPKLHRKSQNQPKMRQRQPRTTGKTSREQKKKQQKNKEQKNKEQKKTQQKNDNANKRGASSMMDGYNDNVRQDGYSKGFFDE